MSNEEIVAAIQNGNNSLMLQLWENVAKLAKKFAYKLYTALEGRRSLTLDDLMQTAYIALCDAVVTYKPDLAAFSTWYVVYLRKHFMEAAGFHGKSKINDPINHASSLDQPIIDGEDITLGDSIEDPRADDTMRSVEDRIWLDQLREVLGEMLLELPEKQADILYRRFWREQTYTEIGNDIGIAGQNVRVNEWRGLINLRSPNNLQRLKSFHEFDCYNGTGMGTYKRTGMSVQERYMIYQNCTGNPRTKALRG